MITAYQLSLYEIRDGKRELGTKLVHTEKRRERGFRIKPKNFKER
jgi:hypothetical protein